jgi:hypothetical protein
LSWDDDDRFSEFIDEAIRGAGEENAKTYLGTFGDAVDRRISTCLAEGRVLAGQGHPGPALGLAATAVELMIRFLLLRPLVHGAFLSEEWAAVLADRIVGGRTFEDRKMLPAVMQAWRVDLTTVRTSADVLVWDFITKELWPARNGFVHRYQTVDPELVMKAVECALAFRGSVVGAVAKRLGFTLETTGCWHQIKGEENTPLGGKRTWNMSYDPKEPAELRN